MNLSRFERAVIHLADTRIVSYILEGAKSEADKQAANALKMFLGEGVKSGRLLEFIRQGDFEARLKR